jgi:hypothetical protein
VISPKKKKISDEGIELQNQKMNKQNSIDSNVNNKHKPESITANAFLRRRKTKGILSPGKSLPSLLI